MQTLILQEPGSFIADEQAIPDHLQPDEVLVSVKKIGICGTDLHAFRGKQPFFSYPRILGHELGVEVVACGEKVEKVIKGDACAVEPYLYCGKCTACTRGKTNCCEFLKVYGVHVDGGMKELMVLPSQLLHSSSKLTFEQLALVETLGIGAHAVQRADILPKDIVLVLGAGPIGLSIIQFLQHLGVPIIVADLDPERLAFCQKYMQVSAAVNASYENFEDQIKDSLQGLLPTIVFDATGNASSMQKAIHLCSSGGKLILVGLYQGDFTFHDPLFHKKEMSILSSRNSTRANFRDIIRDMESGLINTDTWITHRLPFSQVANTFPSLVESRSGLVKAIISL